MKPLQVFNPGARLVHTIKPVLYCTSSPQNGPPETGSACLMLCVRACSGLHGSAMESMAQR